MVSARPPFSSDILDLSLLTSPLCWMHNGHFFLLFGLSASFVHGLWSPVTVIHTVGCDRMNGQQVLWALRESVQKALSQPGALFHLGLGVGFSFSSSSTLQLTSNSSRFLSIRSSNGWTWLSHFSDTPKCSAELVFRRPLPTSYCLCGPTRTVHLNPSALPFTSVWSCPVPKSPGSIDRTFSMESLAES